MLLHLLANPPFELVPIDRRELREIGPEFYCVADVNVADVVLRRIIRAKSCRVAVRISPRSFASTVVAPRTPRHAMNAWPDGKGKAGNLRRLPLNDIFPGNFKRLTAGRRWVRLFLISTGGGHGACRRMRFFFLALPTRVDQLEY